MEKHRDGSALFDLGTQTSAIHDFSIDQNVHERNSEGTPARYSMFEISVAHLGQAGETQTSVMT